MAEYDVTDKHWPGCWRYASHHACAVAEVERLRGEFGKEGDMDKPLGKFKTKGVNPENGKPNVIAFMFSENEGMSLDGGAMAAGVCLTFGELQPFDRSQWVELSENEYEELLEDQREEAA